MTTPVTVFRAKTIRTMNHNTPKATHVAVKRARSWPSAPPRT